MPHTALTLAALTVPAAEAGSPPGRGVAVLPAALPGAGAFAAAARNLVRPFPLELRLTCKPQHRVSRLARDTQRKRCARRAFWTASSALLDTSASSTHQFSSFSPGKKGVCTSSGAARMRGMSAPDAGRGLRGRLQQHTRRRQPLKAEVHAARREVALQNLPTLLTLQRRTACISAQLTRGSAHTEAFSPPQSRRLRPA